MWEDSSMVGLNVPTEAASRASMMMPAISASHGKRREIGWESSVKRKGKYITDEGNLIDDARGHSYAEAAMADLGLPGR